MSNIRKNATSLAELELEYQQMRRHKRKLVRELDDHDTKMIGLKLQIEKIKEQPKQTYEPDEVDMLNEDL